MGERPPQKPTSGDIVTDYPGLWMIVTHPAYRLGFLDAQAGRPIDHDRIRERIFAETPAGALQRLGYGPSMLDDADVPLAQYRYEEGRLTVLVGGLKCRAWGHPDFPPVQVRRFIEQLAATARPTPTDHAGEGRHGE